MRRNSWRRCSRSLIEKMSSNDDIAALKAELSYMRTQDKIEGKDLHQNINKDPVTVTELEEQ